MVSLLKTAKGAIGATVLAIAVLAALFADVLAPLDPTLQNLLARLRPPMWRDDAGQLYVLGTDALGRDLLSRVIHGARVSIMVAIGAVLVSGVIGTTIGLFAGYYRGMASAIVMRFMDIQLSIPMILFAIAWIAFFGAGLLSIIIVISAWGWVQYARLARSIVLSLKEREFVQASVVLGARDGRIILGHILPNLISSMIVMATLQLGEAVLLESALSFLGMGVGPPTATWGSIVSDGRSYIDTAWWIVVFPGAAITLLVLGANFLGDALRDHLDPHHN
ncbi:MAG: ABC transporter permease [Azospirillaceae bacterium]